MNESIPKKLNRLRPDLLSSLQNHSTSDTIPDNLKNAVATYLLLEPNDGEVREAHNNLRDSRNGQPKQT